MEKVILQWLLLALVSFAPLASAQTIKVGGTGAGLQTMRLLGAEFARTRPGVSVEVLPSLGSPGGIRALNAGAIDVAVSARALKAEERAAGAVEMEIGVTPFVFVVAARSTTDALASAEIVDLYAGRRDTWPDGLPVRLVLRTAAGSEAALLYGISPQMKAAHQAAEQRPGMIVSATDQENADILERVPGALGVMSLAQLLSEARQLKALKVDGVAPTPAAVKAKKYPLTMTMYAVTGPKSSPAALEFVRFIRTPVAAAALEKMGYGVRSPGEAR